MTMGTEIRTLDKMLGAIDPEDAVFVLKRLVQGNSALEQKAKKIIEELLSSIDPESIPLIQPHLHSRILEWMTSRRLKFKTMPEDEIHTQNKSSWNAMSDSWSGTILPT